MDALGRGGKIFCPVFAVGRSQEVMVANEAQGIAWLGCPVLEILNNRASSHHPTGSEDDAGARVEEYSIPLLTRIDLLEP